MATSAQEKTYNKILKYYDFADALIQAAESEDCKFSKQQFAIVENIVEELEKYTDQLTVEYIEYVKNGANENTLKNIRAILAEIVAKTEECRHKIEELHAKNQS